jgi:hypothetical protein
MKSDSTYQAILQLAEATTTGIIHGIQLPTRNRNLTLPLLYAESTSQLQLSPYPNTPNAPPRSTTKPSKPFLYISGILKATEYTTGDHHPVTTSQTNHYQKP